MKAASWFHRNDTTDILHAQDEQVWRACFQVCDEGLLYPVDAVPWLKQLQRGLGFIIELGGQWGAHQPSLGVNSSINDGALRLCWPGKQSVLGMSLLKVKHKCPHRSHLAVGVKGKVNPNHMVGVLDFAGVLEFVFRIRPVALQD
jgi:hypothetical protein